MNGRLAHMVMPAKNNAKFMLRSTKQLMPHTEVVNGLWPEEVYSNVGNYCIAPNVFGLASIRNPNACATRVWYLDDILKKLSFTVVKDLMRKEFSASSQSSFNIEHSLNGVSVISEFGERLSIRFSYSKLTGITERAKKALVCMKEYLDDESTVDRLVVEPGQVLILNNRSLLHGRDNLQNHSLYDGSDRWLIRMYGFSYDGWRKLPKKEQLQHVATL
jgi:L-asparagine oxygenase